MDRTDNKTKMLVMAPVTIAIVLLGFASFIEFTGDVSPIERQVLNFEYKRLNVKEIEAALPVKILEWAFDPGRVKNEYALPETSDEAVENEDPEVSMIIISGDSSMAMIDGRLVKEGDIIDDTRVVKIEADRVLLNNEESKWIYVKE